MSNKSSDGCFLAEARFPPFMVDAPRPPCADRPELFGAPFGERAKKRTARLRLAKMICRTCPLRVPCERWAIDTHQIGVWGGTDEFQRAIARRREAA